jgi:hypothetical protein
MLGWIEMKSVCLPILTHLALRLIKRRGEGGKSLAPPPPVSWHLFHKNWAGVLPDHHRFMNACQSPRQYIPLPGCRYGSEKSCRPSSVSSRAG